VPLSERFEIESLWRVVTNGLPCLSPPRVPEGGRGGVAKEGPHGPQQSFPPSGIATVGHYHSRLVLKGEDLEGCADAIGRQRPRDSAGVK